MFTSTTMKKLLWVLAVCALAFAFLGQGSVQAQSSNCQTVNFSDGSVCVWIQRVSNGEYRVRSTITNTNNNTVALRCDIEYGQGNNVYRQGVGACDGTFYYSSNNNTEQVSIDIWFNQNTVRRITQNYNFSNGNRWSSNNNNNDCNYYNSCNNYDDDCYYYNDCNDYDDDCYYYNDCNDYNDDCYYYNNCNNYNDLYDMDVVASTIFPWVNQQVNINLLALQSAGVVYENYRGTVEFSVQSQNSRGNRQTASSSSYYLNRSSYTFTSSNDGQVQLNNVVEFRNSGIYRLVIRDIDANTTKYVQFDVSWSSNNNNNNRNSYRIIPSASQTSPTTNQYINVTLNARYNNNNNTATDYRGTVDFSVQYRSNNSSSRQSASSSNYDLDRSSYTFTSNNNGSVTLNSLLRFYNNGQYRLVIRDYNNNITEYIEFSVGGNNSSWIRGTFNNFGISASRSNPARNESVNITVQARDNNNRRVEDYTRNVSFVVQSRSSNSSSRQNASSSSYYLNRSSYTFSSNDYGSATLNNLVEFSNNGEYRLVVQDTWNNVVGYYTFNVGGTSNSNNNNWSNNPGFTTTQMNQVQWIYNLRPTLISDLEDNYPRLRTNNTRQAREADLYREMYNITRNSSSIYNNYDQFFVAFKDRYVYTLQVR